MEYTEYTRKVSVVYRTNGAEIFQIIIETYILLYDKVYIYVDLMTTIKLSD